MIEYVSLDATQKEAMNLVRTFMNKVIADEMRESEFGGYDAMLDYENWGNLSGAIIAEEHSERHGIVTFAVKGRYGSGDPEISLVYVLPESRNKGIARTLFRKAMESLPSDKVHCDLVNPIMQTIVNGLPEKCRSRLVTR